jgi:hypothetical protein
MLGNECLLSGPLAEAQRKGGSISSVAQFFARTKTHSTIPPRKKDKRKKRNHFYFHFFFFGEKDSLLGRIQFQSTANTSMSFTVKFWAPVKVLFSHPVVSA